jgi:hypothetical protein
MIQLALPLCLAFTAGAQLSNAELEERLLGEPLAPVLAAAEESGGSRLIEIELQSNGATAPRLGQGIADFLQRHGYEAWTKRGASRLPEDGLFLELGVQEAGFSQIEQRRNLLALGAQKTLREADLLLAARLSMAGGELLYEGLLEARAREWIDADAVEPRSDEALLPALNAAQKAAAKEAAGGETSWTERGIALGLLSGVIILYFSGIS